MKKFLSSLALATVMLFAVGCSCSEAAVLAFDNLWKGENIGYKESLSYNVSYIADYNEFGYSFTKSDTLSAFTFDANGTYTSVYEILSKEDPTVPEIVKNNEAYTMDSISSIIRATTRLDLSATYVLGDKTETSEDFIHTTAYFFNSQSSFAPVYTEREISYLYPTVGTSDFVLHELKGKDITEYGKDKYKVSTYYGETAETEYDYTYKTLIDNSSLLLAVRNKKLDKDTSYTLPTVHPSYKSAQNLRLTHFADKEKEITFDYNGEEKTVNFGLNGLSFVVGTINNSGMAQIVFVQNGEKDGIDKSLIVEYVSPLVENGSFQKMGALKYTLSQATYS